MFCLLMCVFFCRNAPICQNLAMFSLSSKSNSCDDTTTHGVHLPWDLWGPTWWLLGDQPQNNNNIIIFCQPQPLCICLHWLIFPAENTVFSTLFLMVVEWQKCGYYFTVLIAATSPASEAAEAGEVSLAKLPSFDRHHENPAKILQIFLRPSRWGRRFFTSFPLQKRRVFGGLFASFYIACHWTLLGYYQKWTKRHNGALLAALQSQTLGFCIDMKKSRLSISDMSKVPNKRTHTIQYSPKQ